LPLLDREQAFAFGGRVKHHGVKINAKVEADRRDAKRRAAKQSGDARQAVEAEAAAAEAALLREELDVKLPNGARSRPGLGRRRRRRRICHRNRRRNRGELRREMSLQKNRWKPVRIYLQERSHGGPGVNATDHRCEWWLPMASWGRMPLPPTHTCPQEPWEAQE
jgi:hypothetical protein